MDGVARRVASPTFVGRQEELEALEAALARAGKAQTAAVFVGGDSGVGKSRLVAEFERRAREGGAQVLIGGCVDLGEAELPYAPLVAALRALARERDADALAELAGPDSAALARLHPELGTGVVAGEPDPLAQVRLFEALLGLLARLGRRAPLVLVVEDLHWADPSTRGFLAFLVRNARREPLVLVATFRSDELHRRHPLRPFLADVERAPGVERLELTPFSREELAAQLEGILEAVPEPRLLDALFERSQGNAFFAEELLAAARAGGTAVPATVRDALTLRVEHLTEPTQRVVRLAAVAGASVGDQLLVAAAGLPEEDVERAVREAVEHNVLVPDPTARGYTFRHALLREALYADLLPGERGGLHRALAEALEREPRLASAAQGAAAERAFHWSGAGLPTEALAASVEAGGEAERLAAFAEANRHFERAVELWEAVPAVERPAQLTLVELLRRAAEAAHLAGDHKRGAALVRRALDSIDAEREPETAGLLHERLGRYLWVQGAPEALEQYRAAARLLPEEANAVRARILAGEAHILMLEIEPEEALERCREAIGIAHAVGALEIECSALNTLGGALAQLGAREEGVETLRRAMHLAEELDSPEELVRSYVNLGEVLDEAERLEEATALVLEGRKRLGDRVSPLLAAEAARRLFRLGRWGEAAAVLSEAAETPGDNVAAGTLLATRAELEASLGQVEPAAGHLEEAMQLLGTGVTGIRSTMFAAPAATVALARGGVAEAAATIAEAVGDEDGRAAFFSLPTYAIGIRAEADLAAHARSLGDEPAENGAVARAQALLGRARSVVAQDLWPLGPPPTEFLLNVELGSLELSRAQRAADADAWAAHAARWEELGRPYRGAYARWREGEAAVEHGLPRERSAAALRSARSTAERLGAQPLLREVEELARRARIDLGGKPEADDAAERLGLTPRELDVLRLLAEGRTNAQIGQTLFMSPKTASVHVSHILAKLHVKTRLEAATAAHRIGLTR
jgi:DNA-binding CsgD family transcriptional regulator/tetratricopeptide (TPR) repeat protein